MLAWAIGTRQFLGTPSRPLLLFSLLAATACFLLNRWPPGTVPAFTSQVSCLICAFAIGWWEKLAKKLGVPESSVNRP